MIPGRNVSNDRIETEVSIEVGNVTLDGTLALPNHANAVALFAHGSGSSRHSPRNRYVARVQQSQVIGATKSLSTNPPASFDSTSLSWLTV
jgi:hypothetical protein